MIKIRLYEGPELDDGFIEELNVAAVPRVGEMIRTTLSLLTSGGGLQRDRYVVRAVEHAFFGSPADGTVAWDDPTIWVLVEAQ